MGGLEPMTRGMAAADLNGCRHYSGGCAAGNENMMMISCGGGTGVGCGGGSRSFRMPLHYPRYNKADYETMPEWKLDLLLADYGLPATGDLRQKQSSAMGAFLWD